MSYDAIEYALKQVEAKRADLKPKYRANQIKQFRFSLSAINRLDLLDLLSPAEVARAYKRLAKDVVGFRDQTGIYKQRVSG